MVLGERVGALVAAEAARELEARHLLLWHPVTDIEAYQRELGQAAKLQKVSTGIEAAGDDGAADFKQATTPATATWSASRCRALIESFVGHQLADSRPGADCAVHLVQFGRKRLDPRFEGLLDAWRQARARSSRTCSPSPAVVVRPRPLEARRGAAPRQHRGAGGHMGIVEKITSRQAAAS